MEFICPFIFVAIIQMVCFFVFLSALYDIAKAIREQTKQNDRWKQYENQTH